MDKNKHISPDPELLIKLARTRMPFGRYKDRLLIDLPEPYLVWFSQKGFPNGQLGDMLRMVYEIKLNGLEYLFKPLRII
ncbi:MAG: DUF3820 family protein [Deltaproteobacteria bacterium]|nr:DUF3820 family protein [Deltaproteobacteria bacterium]